ncbi:MAG: endonuclease [Bacteroidota bacterium]
MKRIFTLISLLLFITSTVFAQIPAGYYNTATGLSGESLRSALKTITTTGHVKLSYADVWIAYATTDVKPSTNNTIIWDMYTDIPSGTPITTLILSSGQCGTSGSAEGICYSREHCLPNSWWGHYNDAAHPQYTDLHHLFPADQYVNLHKSNYPIGQTNAPTYTSNNGSKLGPCSYPGYTGLVFEPINEYKGDFARAYLYMATRYMDSLGTWVKNFPTYDSRFVIDTLTNNYKQWFIDMLLAWHAADTVSAKEINRNNAIYNTNQKNRNPFVDHPEYVQAIWGGPAVIKQEPSNFNTNILAANTSPLKTTITVSWTDATGTVTPDGYLIRASSVGFSQIQNPTDGTPESITTMQKMISSGVQSAVFTNLTAGTLYYFKIFPFTNTGNNIDYKTNGTIPSVVDSTSSSGTALQEGDIAFVGYQFANPDKFAFVLLKDVSSNTTITFTDNAWDGNAFKTSEGSATWTAPPGGLIAGTLIKIEGTIASGGGTVNSNSMQFNQDGDQIIAFQGSSSFPVFITSISSNPFINLGIVSASTSYLPSVLNNKSDAISFATVKYNGYYVGTTSGTINFLRAAINDSLNWITSNAFQTWPSSWVFSVSSSSVISQNTNLLNLSIAPTEKMTINNGSVLTIEGSLTIQSDSTGTGSIIESNGLNAIVQRYIANPDQFHMLASAVANQAISSIVSSNDSLYLWNEPSETWTSYTANNFATMNGGMNFQTGKAYAVSFPSVVTKNFSGALNHGIVNIPLSFTTGNFSGWNYIANPYPSAINWNSASGFTRAMLANVGSTSKAIWIWNPDSANYGCYLSESIDPGTNGVSQYIAASQGFWVKAVSSGTFKMNDSVRVHASQSWLKASTASPDMLRINVSGNGNTYSDEIIINYGKTNDQFGAEKMFSMEASAPSLYTTKLNKNWSINYLTTINEHPTVPLGFKAGVNGIYTLHFTGNEQFNQLILEDLQTNIQKNMFTSSSYTFVAQTTDNAERFILHFTSVANNINGIQNSDIQIYTNNSTIYINTQENIDEIKVFSLLGQLILKQTGNTNTIRNIPIENSAAYYLVKVITEKNVYTKKLFIN